MDNGSGNGDDPTAWAYGTKGYSSEINNTGLSRDKRKCWDGLSVHDWHNRIHLLDNASPVSDAPMTPFRWALFLACAVALTTAMIIF
jgi:hypothetical protein